MRKLTLLPLLLIITGLLTVQAAELHFQVFIKEYNGTAELGIFGENLSKVETVKNGSIISLPAGNYTLTLFALNKTFVKDLRLDSNKTVTFNLLFTNRTENLSMMRHAIVQPSLEVFEIALITNSGGENFEGDLAIPLPEHTGLKISDSSLSFLDFSDLNGNLTLKKLIVPANSTGEVSITYRLVKPKLSLSGAENQTVLIFTTLPVTNQSNAAYRGVQQFKGVDYSVYQCKTKCVLEFKVEPEIKIDKTSAFVILTASALIFIYLFTKRGGWEK
jgi:hypothetical protein